MDVHLTQDLADEFAVGSLDPETERLVRLHVAACEPCRALVRESDRYATTLALNLGPRRVPEGLKQRVFVAAGIQRPSAIVRAITWGRAVAAVAAVLVAVVALSGMFAVKGQVSGLRAENQDLQRQIDDALSQRIEIAALTQRLARTEEQSAELQAEGQADRELLIAQLSPSTDIADVVGVNEYSTAVGRLLWDDDQKRVWFLANNLPPRPNGETYEIWVNNAGRWISLGRFNSDATGFARTEAWVPQGLTSYESVVVTIERSTRIGDRSGQSVFVTDLRTFRR